MTVSAIGLLVANSASAPIYFGILKTYVGGLSVLHWVNDALMAMFFLLVGLEIKRELIDGQLASWPRRILPGIAATAGMAAPAVIYVALNAGSAETLRGWAIPAATDIAFALGVLALLGSRVPVSLKIFLTALAILDDLGAVLIIAMFYTADLSLQWLGLAGAVLVVLAGFNRAGMTSLVIYLLLGAVLWFFVLKSGVHATLAGVALAFTVPLRATPALPDHPASPLHRLEHAIHPSVAFLIPGCRLGPVLRQASRDISKHMGDGETRFGARARRIILASDLRNFRSCGRWLHDEPVRRDARLSSFAGTSERRQGRSIGRLADLGDCGDARPASSSHQERSSARTPRPRCLIWYKALRRNPSTTIRKLRSRKSSLVGKRTFDALDDRCAIATASEMALQVQPVYVRHLDVDDQAGGRAAVRRGQEVLGPGKSFRPRPSDANRLPSASRTASSSSSSTTMATSHLVTASSSKLQKSQGEPRLASTVASEGGHRILAYAKELEEQAARLEAQFGGQGAAPPRSVVHEQQQAQQQTQTPDETKPKAWRQLSAPQGECAALTPKVPATLRQFSQQLPDHEPRGQVCHRGSI